MSDAWMPPIPLGDETDSSDIWRLLERPAWHREAACRGMGAELFFPERGDLTNDVKRVCAGCKVNTECGQFALASPYALAGVWGGMSQKERRRLKPRRSAA